MTSAAIDTVVKEIEAYGRGERPDKLNWKALCEYSGFSQVSLWKKPAIKAAFARVRQSQRADATPAISPPRTVDERVAAVQKTIDELRANIRAYDQLWALYEYNIQRLGVASDELRRPLPSPNRETVKSSRVRLLR